MKKDTLKELINLYSQIPCGLLIFKKDNLYFINNHLRATLTLGNITANETTEIISSILHIPSKEITLHKFFIDKSFLAYKDKYIQINHKTYQDYDLFIFTKIDKSVLSDICQKPTEENKIPFKEIEDSTLETVEDVTDKEILEYFDKNYNVKTTGYVLYKGVPLISENIILKTYKDMLAVKIEDKQLIASKVGAKWIIELDSNKNFKAVIKHINNIKKIIFLSMPKNIKLDFHNRELIRYKVHEPLSLTLTLNNTETSLEIVDISEKSLKAITDNGEILDILHQQELLIPGKIKLNDEVLKLECRFLRVGESRNKKAEIVFLFTLDKSTKKLLNKWLNGLQIKIIRELRTYINN